MKRLDKNNKITHHRRIMDDLKSTSKRFIADVRRSIGDFRVGMRVFWKRDIITTLNNFPQILVTSFFIKYTRKTLSFRSEMDSVSILD